MTPGSSGQTPTYRGRSPREKNKSRFDEEPEETFGNNLVTSDQPPIQSPANTGRTFSIVRARERERERERAREKVTRERGRQRERESRERETDRQKERESRERERERERAREECSRITCLYCNFVCVRACCCSCRVCRGIAGGSREVGVQHTPRGLAAEVQLATSKQRAINEQEQARKQARLYLVECFGDG
jgi:hypothetical protein